MEPQHAITYNNSNENKKVIYRTFVTNNYPAVAAGGNLNQLINSGDIVHPTGVLIVPFLGAVTGTNGGLGDSQWKSCFDTCPCTTSAVSLCKYKSASEAKTFYNLLFNMVMNIS